MVNPIKRPALPPEVLAREVRRDAEVYAPIVRQANIKAE